MTMLDLTQPIQTRDGRTVQLFITDNRGNFPLVGAYESQSGYWIPRTWKATGAAQPDASDSALDLINVPETFTGEVWLNIFETWVAKHDSRAAAESYRFAASRVACIRVPYSVTRGEGLS